jgi:hypothetical protein
MTRFNLDYEEYEFPEEDLLLALQTKECIEDALEELRSPNSYKTELLLKDNNNFLISIYYYNAKENKENNSKISN